MAYFYFDTSALFKRYVRERGWEVVDRIFASGAKNRSVTSFLTTAEFVSALSVARRIARRIRDADVKAAKAQFDQDIQNLFAILWPVDNDLVRQAVSLIERHLLGTGDALHLATALRLRELMPERVIFVSADGALCRAARAEGLEVVNPEGRAALRQVVRIDP